VASRLLPQTSHLLRDQSAGTVDACSAVIWRLVLHTIRRQKSSTNQITQWRSYGQRLWT